MQKKEQRKPTKREYVTVAEAKRSDKKRSTIERGIQYDRVTENYIVTLYSGMKDGKPDREHKTYKTLKEAREKLIEHKASVKDGKRATSNPKLTFGECITEFIEKADIERTTARGYEVIARRIKETELYGKRISDIKKRDIENYKTQTRAGEKMKPKTINKDLDLMRRALRYAVEQGNIESNPAADVKPLKVEEFEANPLTTEELKEICERAEESGDWQLIIPIYLGAFQGLRRGEVIGLKWDMISFDENIIHIKETVTQIGGETIHKPPKTKESKRPLDMFPKVRELLLQCREWQKERGVYGEYVVANKYGSFTSPTFLSKKFNRFLKQNGFREIRFHDLRHTFATRAISAGVDVLSVSKAMGHSNLKTTLGIYAHSKSLDGSKAVNEGLQKIFG